MSPRYATNAALIAPYAAPFLAYVGTASLARGLALGPTQDYALRIVLTSFALVWSWRHYVPLRGPHSASASIAVGTAAGLLGTLLWVTLKAPFFAQEGPAWPPAAFLLRTLASSTLVAVFEELLFRGYVLRLTLQWEEARRAQVPHPLHTALEKSRIAEVAPGAWTPLAVAVSTLAFASGHRLGEYPAAIAYGLLMAALWVVRRDLLGCVVAHGVTNLTLALYVCWSGSWGLW